MAEPLLVAKHGPVECFLLPGLANRHGLITGATGTGKTVTLQTLAEGFSRIGVPVFMADIKGDLTGISQTGKVGEKMAATLKERGIDVPEPMACPTTLWDVFGEQGHRQFLVNQIIFGQQNIQFTPRLFQRVSGDQRLRCAALLAKQQAYRLAQLVFQQRLN